jgi:hypothetical protein
VSVEKIGDKKEVHIDVMRPDKGKTTASIHMGLRFSFFCSVVVAIAMSNRCAATSDMLL